MIAFIPAKWLTALPNTCTFSSFAAEMKEAVAAISAISYKRGSSMLAHELFKVYQGKNVNVGYQMNENNINSLH